MKINIIALQINNGLIIWIVLYCLEIYYKFNKNYILFKKKLK